MTMPVNAWKPNGVLLMNFLYMCNGDKENIEYVLAWKDDRSAYS